MEPKARPSVFTFQFSKEPHFPAAFVIQALAIFPQRAPKTKQVNNMNIVTVHCWLSY